MNDSPGMTGFADLEKRFAALSSGKATKVILGQFGLLAVQRAKERVHKRTGNLSRTIRVESVDVAHQTVRVVAGGALKVGYARDEEMGTKPHTIRARNRKVLAWGGARRLSGSLLKGSKATHFARVVHHPGTPAHPYLVPGAQQALREVGLSDAVVKIWDEAA